MSIKPYAPEITFEEYCTAIASLSPGAPEVAISLPGPMMKWLGEVKEFLDQIVAEVSMPFTQLLIAFQTRDMFALMKAIGWSLKKLVQGVDKFMNLIPAGLLKIMHHLQASGLVQKLQEGTAKIDDILNKYPLLKKLAGPALAGFLLWMWMNATLVGSFSFDMDLSFVINAFKGTFTLTDLFLSPEGMTMIALFAAGMVTGIGVGWLGSSIRNLLLALAYTVTAKLKPAIAQKLKPYIEKKKY
jgi:hypothetical protein